MDPGDRRRFRRVGCRIACLIEDVDADHPHRSKAVISDISEGGIRFSSRYRFPLSYEKYVTLEIPGRKTITAKVRPVWDDWVFRQLHYETGACFVNIGLEDRYALKGFVNSKL